MSLFNELLEECIFINIALENDGLGGWINQPNDGATFQATIGFDTSIEARVGEKQGVTSLYTVTTPKRGLILKYHDIFKRKSDGKVFRVTSDGDDKFTPDSAEISMRQVTAEEYDLNVEINKMNAKIKENSKENTDG